jgi:hypothetical protein
MPEATIPYTSQLRWFPVLPAPQFPDRRWLAKDSTNPRWLEEPTVSRRYQFCKHLHVELFPITHRPVVPIKVPNNPRPISPLVKLLIVRWLVVIVPNWEADPEVLPKMVLRCAHSEV